MTIKIVANQRVQPEDVDYSVTQGVTQTRGLPKQPLLPVGVTEESLAGPFRDKYLDFRQQVTRKYGLTSDVNNFEIDPSRKLKVGKLGVFVKEREGGVGTVAKIGAVNTAAAIVGAFEALSDGAIGTETRRNLQSYAEQLTQTLDQETLEDVNAQWALEGPNTVLNNPDSVFTQLVLQLGNYAATIAPSIAGGVAGFAVGGPPGAVIGGALGGATAEGAIVAGATYAEIAEGIEQAPEEVLLQSPIYQDLRNRLDLTQARAELTSIIARGESLQTGLVSAGFGAAAGGVLGKLITSPLRRTARGLVGSAAETVTEAPQEAYEQYRANILAGQTYDPGRTPGEGVLGAAAAGGVLSAGPGFVGGALTPRLGVQGSVPDDVRQATDALQGEPAETVSRAEVRERDPIQEAVNESLIRSAIPAGQQLSLPLQGGQAAPLGAEGEFRRQIGGELPAGPLAAQVAADTAVRETRAEQQAEAQRRAQTELTLPGGFAQDQQQIAEAVPTRGQTKAIEDEQFIEEFDRQKEERIKLRKAVDVERQQAAAQDTLPLVGGKVTKEEAVRQATQQLEEQGPVDTTGLSAEVIEGIERVDEFEATDEFYPVHEKLTLKNKGAKAIAAAQKLYRAALNRYANVADVSAAFSRKLPVTEVSKFLDRKRENSLFNVFGGEDTALRLMQKSLSNIIRALESKKTRVSPSKEDYIKILIQRASESIARTQNFPINVVGRTRKNQTRAAANSLLQALIATRGVILSESESDAFLDRIMSLPKGKSASRAFLNAVVGYGDAVAGKITPQESTALLTLEDFESDIEAFGQNEGQLRDYLWQHSLNTESKLNIRDKEGNLVRTETLPALVSLARDRIERSKDIQKDKKSRLLDPNKIKKPLEKLSKADKTAVASFLIEESLDRQLGKLKVTKGVTKAELIDIIVNDVINTRRQIEEGFTESNLQKLFSLEKERQLAGRRVAREEKRVATKKAEPKKPKKVRPGQEKRKKTLDKSNLEKQKETEKENALSIFNAMLLQAKGNLLDFRVRLRKLKATNLHKLARKAGIEFKGRPKKEELVNIVSLEKNIKYVEDTLVDIRSQPAPVEATKVKTVEEKRRELKGETAAALKRESKQLEKDKALFEIGLADRFLSFAEKNPKAVKVLDDLAALIKGRLVKLPATKQKAVEILDGIADYLKKLDKDLNKEGITYGFSLHGQKKTMVPLDVELARYPGVGEVASFGDLELTGDTEIGKAKGLKRISYLERLRIKAVNVKNNINKNGWNAQNRKDFKFLLRDFDLRVPQPPIITKFKKPQPKQKLPGILNDANLSENAKDYSDLGHVVRLVFNDGGATSDRLNLNSLLDFIVVEENTYVEQLVQKLRGLNLQVGVRLVDELSPDIAAEYDHDTRNINIARSTLERVAKDTSGNRNASMGRLFLHEVLHAATLPLLTENVPAAREMARLYNIAKKRLTAKYGKSNLFYGLNNVAEFVAEAFANPEFRKELESLSVSSSDGVVASLKQWFVNIVRKLFGLNTEFNNLLDEVISAGENLFATEEQVQDTLKNPEKYGNKLVYGPTPGLLRDLFEESRVRTRQFGLGAMSLRQIIDSFRGLFSSTVEGIETNHISEYDEIYFAKHSAIHRLLQQASSLNNKWSTLKAKHPHAFSMLERVVMGESTRLGIHPDKKLNDPENAHIKNNARNRHLHATLEKAYKGLPKEVRDFYKEIRQWYADDRELKVEVARENIYDIYEVDQKPSDAKIDELTSKDKPLAEEAKEALKNLISYKKLPGPYFPLKRFGNYAVKAKTQLSFYGNTQDEALADAKDYLKGRFNPDEVDIVTTDDGRVRVDTTDKVFSLYETYSQASTAIKQMNESGEYTDISAKPELKEALYKATDIPSIQFLQSVISKMGEDADSTVINALKEVYLEALPETSVRKMEIKRKGVLGYSTDMQRTFASYARASSYHKGQLKFGPQIADAVRRIQTHTNITDDQYKLIRQQVVRELRLRDRMEAKLSNPMPWVGRLNDVGFLWYLLSPSYWFVNSTQVYMLSLPWMGSRFGIAKSTVALGRAYKEIMPSALRKSFESGFGIKAFKDFKTEEELFDVQKLISKVEETDSRRADMLRFLGDQNLLEISFAAAIKEEAVTRSKPGEVWNRVMEATRSMPHIVEVMNRTVTALAAYDLAMEKHNDFEIAKRAARDAVSDTHFDYSGANKPRYFSSRYFAAAGPLLMFKQHAQHVYYTLIKRTLDLFQGNDRKQAAKHLALLFGTHGSMAGVIGMTWEPIKWAIGLTAALIHDEDDEPFDYEFWVRDAFADATSPQIAEILARGLPRAFGGDLSGRLGLQNMMFLDRNMGPSDRKAVQNIVFSAIGPLASIPDSMWQGVIDLREGDTLRAMERFVPKGFRDMIKTARMSTEGIMDATGNVMLDSDKLNAKDFFYQSMGITPSRVSEVYDQRGIIKKKDAYANKRRQQLMEKYRRASNKGKVWRDEIRAFNRANPAYKIPYSSLITSLNERRRREREMRRTGGVYLDRKKRSAYRDELEIYNTGE